MEAEEKRLGTMGPVGEQIAAAESTPNEIPHVPVRESYLYLSPTFEARIKQNTKNNEKEIMNRICQLRKCKAAETLQCAIRRWAAIKEVERRRLANKEDMDNLVEEMIGKEWVTNVKPAKVNGPTTESQLHYDDWVDHHLNDVVRSDVR